MLRKHSWLLGLILSALLFPGVAQAKAPKWQALGFKSYYQYTKARGLMRTEIATWLTQKTKGNFHVHAPFTKADVRLSRIGISPLEIALPAGNLLLQTQWKARRIFRGMSNYHVDNVPFESKITEGFEEDLLR